jgi:hypothetical protein
MTLITQEVATNIAQHAQQAWTYSVPNDSTGEIVITNGLKPFYPNAEQRGGSTTIVDVKVDNIALDIKCRDVLGIFLKEHSEKQRAKAPSKEYYQVENIWIGKPKFVHSPVRRPSVDLENYQGDCKRIMTEQIAEYKAYAERTTKEAGCTELRSVLFLYGEAKGYKAIYIEEQPFATPTPVRFETAKSYKAFDQDDRLLYEISDYSKGSTNFNKRFDCNKGFLFVWPSQALATHTVTPTDWKNAGNFSSVI